MVDRYEPLDDSRGRESKQRNTTKPWADSSEKEFSKIPNTKMEHETGTAYRFRDEKIWKTARSRSNHGTTTIGTPGLGQPKPS